MLKAAALNFLTKVRANSDVDVCYEGTVTLITTKYHSPKLIKIKAINRT